MSKRIIKKTRLKLIPFFIVILILAMAGFCVYAFFNIPIQNIVIKGTNYLKDDYIIDIAGIKDYPSFSSINTSNIRKKLNKSSYISDSKIKIRFFNVLEINVDENRPLYLDNNKQNIVFSNGDSVKLEDEITIFRVPRLINYVPDNKIKEFIKRMNRVKEEILGNISDIEYVPNEFDKDRFLLYMDDGNSVYVTLTKFDNINYYSEVLPQLEGRKGILYLDSGNHFEIKE